MTPMTTTARSTPDATTPAGPPGGGASRLLSAVDWISDQCARLGMVMVALIAGFLFYEVVARYVFLAPTIWTQDVSVTLQVWFTYLGMAWVLRHRDMIRITAVTGLLGRGPRKVLEAFSLLVIVAFSVMAVWEGWRVVEDSIRLGRRQPTMLELPNWIAEVPVILGFLLLALQGVAELIRLPTRTDDDSAGGSHFAPPEGADAEIVPPPAPTGRRAAE